MTHEATIRRLARMWGSRLRQRRKGIGRRVYDVEVSRMGQLEWVLNSIRPWSVTKAKEIDTVLRFLRTRLPRIGKWSTPQERRSANRLYWRLRELKREQ